VSDHGLFNSTTSSSGQQTHHDVPSSRPFVTVSSTENDSGTLMGSYNSLFLQEEKAYPQQTPHSGRHFLPSHPAYHQGDTSSSSSSKRRSQVRKHLSKIKQQSKNLFMSTFRYGRRHAYRNKHKRFMEGWYYRITLPKDNVSFAFIFSIEDPNYYDSKLKNSLNGQSSSSTAGAVPNNLSLAAVQVMGPNDEYVVQAHKDHSKFWASDKQQAFGCTFDSSVMNSIEPSTKKSSSHPVIDPEQFHSVVQSGFQMLPTRLQGKVRGHDGSLGGVLDGQGIPRTCDFDMTIRPLSGWGNDDDHRQDHDDDAMQHDKKHANAHHPRYRSSRQKSTAGWLASFSVFEPHWQVTLADARATGFATWNGKRYDFENVPFYAEKNWGGSFPSKWYWVQCNSFEGYTCPEGQSRLSLTAGGGIRKIPFGKTEELGMVCVHLNGSFYEAVPWTGDMEWNVDPWGSWSFSAKCTSGERLFEVQVTAKCEEEGVVLRAPTPDLGLAYFCRDSFYANVELSLYEIYWDKEQKKHVRGPAILENVRSLPKTGAVEIGGGPYWNSWRGKSKMKQPMKALVKLPYLFQRR
jgi:tocopherol cyclase